VFNDINSSSTKQLNFITSDSEAYQITSSELSNLTKEWMKLEVNELSLDVLGASHTVLAF
jgi:hypothetical protein